MVHTTVSQTKGGGMTSAHEESGGVKSTVITIAALAALVGVAMFFMA